MKRILMTAVLTAVTLVASGQTGLYKRYAHRAGVQAYCVEKYPLDSGDSVCVTLLQTDDTAVYRTLFGELHKLPYTPKRGQVKGSVSVDSRDSLTAAMADSLVMRWREHKHLVIFNADGLPGDKGYYAIYCPSDRMVVLAFLVRSDSEGRKIISHMVSSELNLNK